MRTTEASHVPDRTVPIRSSGWSGQDAEIATTPHPTVKGFDMVSQIQASGWRETSERPRS
jgi:hypothetical protein